MNKKTITLLLPTLNEVVGFKAIFPKIDTSLFDEILVIDGGSTDGTVEYARSQNINLVTQKEKGLGPAVMEAMSIIKTDCVIEFSLDGNCLVEQLEQIVESLQKGDDLVVVSRYLPPAVSYDDTLITAFGNKMFTFLIGLLGKFNPTDTLTIYRGFDIKIAKFPEFKKFLYGPVFEPLISAVAINRNLSISEIPGDEPARIGGKSKMSVVYNGFCIVLCILRMYFFKIFKLTV
tara:strand:+ start:992 stop:1690 length:699 start_codon:yes stop_codon:yes gene_type:complete